MDANIYKRNPNADQKFTDYVILKWCDKTNTFHFPMVEIEQLQVSAGYFNVHDTYRPIINYNYNFAPYLQQNITNILTGNTNRNFTQSSWPNRLGVFAVSVGVETKVPQTQTKCKNSVSVSKSSKPKLEPNISVRFYSILGICFFFIN